MVCLHGNTMQSAITICVMLLLTKICNWSLCGIALPMEAVSIVGPCHCLFGSAHMCRCVLFLGVVDRMTVCALWIPWLHVWYSVVRKSSIEVCTPMQCNIAAHIQTDTLQTCGFWWCNGPWDTIANMQWLNEQCATHITGQPHNPDDHQIRKGFAIIRKYNSATPTWEHTCKHAHNKHVFNANFPIHP